MIHSLSKPPERILDSARSNRAKQMTYLTALRHCASVLLCFCAAGGLPMASARQGFPIKNAELTQTCALPALRYDTTVSPIPSCGTSLCCLTFIDKVATLVKVLRQQQRT